MKGRYTISSLVFSLWFLLLFRKASFLYLGIKLETRSFLHKMMLLQTFAFKDLGHIQFNCYR